MARQIIHLKGTINATATESEDDVRITFDRIKHITGKSVLLDIGGDDYWIPFSQIIDAYLMDNELIITNWIAEQKELA